ncbi:hypothetical protein KAU33_00200 [Candidatus Dependentiae bacterium]|nr:hypothetical protein [Candidatus Dependentiae bacterium]
MKGRTKKGSVLLTLLIVIFIISTMLALVFSTILFLQRKIVNQIKQLDAKLITEAGIDECLYKLQNGQLIYYTYDEEFSNGKYKIRYMEFEDTFTIECTGFILNDENVISKYRATVRGEIIDERYVIKKYIRGF